MSGAYDPSAGFGWADGKAKREKVPVVDFDFDAVFRRLDEEPGAEAQQPARRLALSEVLSPGELLSALAVARRILRRASPRSRSARRKWRDPVIRRRLIEVMRRRSNTPETKRRLSEAAQGTWRNPVIRLRRSEGIRRSWRDPLVRQRIVEGMRRAARTLEGRQARRRNWLDPAIRERMLNAIRLALNAPEARRKLSDWSPERRQKMREFMRRLCRERRDELLARRRRPEYRKKRSELARARWADPASRKKLLELFRSPEVRRQKSLSMRRYFQEHPDARKRHSEALRVGWRDPVLRSRRIQGLRASWTAAKAAASARGESGGDARRFLKKRPEG